MVKLNQNSSCSAQLLYGITERKRIHIQAEGSPVPDSNKRNLVYFENSSMRGLYGCMDEWQEANQRRLLSISIQADQGKYCCIALTNPTEVVITSKDGRNHAIVSNNGNLFVTR